MKIYAGDNGYEANPQNTVILLYPNDMMNGIFVDLPGDHYLYEPMDSDTFYQDAALATSEGVPTIPVNPNFDPSAVPHCYVINSLARLTVATARTIMDSADGEG